MSLRRALSIRQPYAELILRGVKTSEYRSRPTRIVGERFWIYASKKEVEGSRQRAEGIWSTDLSVGEPPGWIVELAGQVGMIDAEAVAGLPVGVVVGSAVIEAVEPVAGGLFAWKLGGVRRARTLRRPTGQPQPVWFVPWAA